MKLKVKCLLFFVLAASSSLSFSEECPNVSFVEGLRTGDPYPYGKEVNLPFLGTARFSCKLYTRPLKRFKEIEAFGRKSNPFGMYTIQCVYDDGYDECYLLLFKNFYRIKGSNWTFATIEPHPTLIELRVCSNQQGCEFYSSV